MKMDLLNILLIISVNHPTNNSKEATLIIQKATKKYQSSEWRQVPGLAKVVKEKVKNVSVQTIDIIDNNLIDAVSDVKNKLNHEIDNFNCYVQTNFDTKSDDEVDDGTYNDSFAESDFDEQFKYFNHYYLIIFFENALFFYKNHKIWLEPGVFLFFSSYIFTFRLSYSICQNFVHQLLKLHLTL